MFYDFGYLMGYLFAAPFALLLVIIFLDFISSKILTKKTALKKLWHGDYSVGTVFLYWAVLFILLHKLGIGGALICSLFFVFGLKKIQKNKEYQSPNLITGIICLFFLLLCFSQVKITLQTTKIFLSETSTEEKQPILQKTNLVKEPKLKDLADEFELIGNWALDCDSKDIQVNYYTDRSGSIIRYMIKSEIERFSTIKNIEKIDENTIRIIETYGEGWGDHRGVQKKYILLFSESRDQYRSINSQYGDKKTYIKNGIVEHTGKESPTVKKCD